MALTPAPSQPFTDGDSRDPWETLDTDNYLVGTIVFDDMISGLVNDENGSHYVFGKTFTPGAAFPQATLDDQGSGNFVGSVSTESELSIKVFDNFGKKQDVTYDTKAYTGLEEWQVGIRVTDGSPV